MTVAAPGGAGSPTTQTAQAASPATPLEPSAGAYASWGMAVRDSGRPEEAKGIFERAIATDPNSPNGYNQLGLVYLDETKWDEAAENFAKASRLSPR